MALFTVLCSVVLLCAAVPAWSDKHSLYYIYTALSKPVELPGIYEFTAMGLLDDRQIDYYNSKDKQKIPSQHWMKEKMEKDYWEKGTQSRKSKEQWFNVNVKILMDRMRHNVTDVHVLQWRHGCEIEEEGTKVKFSKGIDEYSYDGDNFLSFDDKESQWVAPVDAALPTKKKWDNVPILNQYTKGYLEKECVDWLNKFRVYGDEELQNGSPPDVRVFAKKSTSDKTKLKLTCMATGFYPKDVTLGIRKYRSFLPDKEIESTGTRPNNDGTFQLRKSVEINENEKAEYDCYVFHKTLKDPIIVKWNGTCNNCNEGSFLAVGVGIGVVVTVVFVAGLCFYLYKTKRLLFKSKNVNDSSEDEENGVAAGEQSASDPLVMESAAPRSQEEGEGDRKDGSERSGSPDSGKGSPGPSKDNSPTNSLEQVNIVDSNGKSIEENRSLLQQNNA